MSSTSVSPPERTTRVAWFNGSFMPEFDVRVPFRDLSFLRGQGAYDMARTFGGHLHRLEDHVARLYRTLRYIDVDPGFGPHEMIALSEETLARNVHLLTQDSDYWVCQRVTAGLQAVGDEGWEHTGPNVIVECRPLPLRKRAATFVDGARLVVAPIPRTGHAAISARGKMHNYLNVALATNEVRRIDPGAWPVMLDEDGYLAEAEGSNLFLVMDGALWTPRVRNILPGIARDTVMRLAGAMGVAVHEHDLDLFDAANADEMFLTGTGFCVCPAASFNGRRLPAGVPGPLTSRLMQAFCEEVRFDYVAQYRRAGAARTTT